MQSQNLCTTKITKEITFEQVAAALNHMAGDCADSRERNARALGHAEVLLWQALFQTAEEWTRARNLMLKIILEADA